MSLANRLEVQLAELRAEFAAAVSAPRPVMLDQHKISLVVFNVGKSIYALPTAQLLQVVRASQLVTVPGASPAIAGAVTHRQEIYSVLKLDGHSEEIDNATGWILLLRDSKRRCGLVVSGLREVLKVSASELVARNESALTASNTNDADASVGRAQAPTTMTLAKNGQFLTVLDAATVGSAADQTGKIL